MIAKQMESSQLQPHLGRLAFIIGVSGLSLVIALFGLAMRLYDIAHLLADNRAILSEIRDSNWIMACDDIDPKANPETFIHCHN